MDPAEELQQRLSMIWGHLDERSRRLVAASEAKTLGYGGVSCVSRACGLSRNAIARGIAEIDRGNVVSEGRIRRVGAGRHRATVCDPGLVEAIEALIEPTERGDPEAALRWTCKSTRVLSRELQSRSHVISHQTVARMLRGMNYSLQGTSKTEEGKDHPDRDAQFRYINTSVKRMLNKGLPVISVDTKKKELVGNYHNEGRRWRRKKSPVKVNGHDFPDPDVPRAFPYGVYDLARNTGFVNVGTDHDTAAFAVASIRGWWRYEGQSLYPRASRLLITADAGGSNGWRLRLWKVELQKFCNDSGLTIDVSHFPPGTSKWNKIEHRLFSFISSNWRGEPLRDYVTIVQLISNTTTAKGLTVTCRLDRRKYPSGRKVADSEMCNVRIKPSSFHGDWNYTIEPIPGVPS
jgi:hypothetical protein